MEERDEMSKVLFEEMSVAFTSFVEFDAERDNIIAIIITGFSREEQALMLWYLGGDAKVPKVDKLADGGENDVMKSTAIERRARRHFNAMRKKLWPSAPTPLLAKLTPFTEHAMMNETINRSLNEEVYCTTAVPSAFEVEKPFNPREVHGDAHIGKNTYSVTFAGPVEIFNMRWFSATMVPVQFALEMSPRTFSEIVLCLILFVISTQLYLH